MYSWLDAALTDDRSTVVTANRRLARELHIVFGERRLQSGVTAWRRPAIYSWNEWLSVLIESGRPDVSLPPRINAQQSRVVWEQCLRADVDDPLVDIGSLARLCRDTWVKLHEWQVPLEECQGRAVGQDQRIFARAAGRYAERLRSEDWIDDALLPAKLTKEIERGRLSSPATLTLAGFDRMTPQADALVNAAVRAGANKRVIAGEEKGDPTLVRCDNADGELRAAGRWARDNLAAMPDARLAIIVSDLEQDAVRSARLLRDGFVPGWQYGTDEYAQALNVSFGRRLVEYPAVHDALLMLRFLIDDMAAADISLLLRSPFFGEETNFGRARLELRLRDVPDRQWSRTALLQFLLGAAKRDECGDAADWLDRIAGAARRLQQCPAQQAASRWAAVFDEILQALSWPGAGALDSEDFQLINRWRDLLNEFARLDVVNNELGVRDAVARLGALAGETIFQAETAAPIVNVLGALEAAGMEFDKIWVTGLTASAWPPPGRPLVLVSRELQQERAMPDSTPDDTSAFAERVLDRLVASAREVVFSFPRLEGDAEQTPSALVAAAAADAAASDGGWHAATLIDQPLAEIADRIPAVRDGEKLEGGAAIIDRHRTDPFAAFARGRLGIRPMLPFRVGISARVRGNLVHDALQRLYEELPGQAAINQWSAVESRERIARCVDQAFERHRRYADRVLGRLLAIENERSAALLRSVLDVDRAREPFSIESVEGKLSVTLSGATFDLRCDRIDRCDDGALIVIDYKTGTKQRFLKKGEPGNLQLVVYACALDAAIAGLALFNVDSRETGLDGAGPAFGGEDDWQERLDQWIDGVRAAAAMIAAGDVRLNAHPGSRDASLDILSRYAELRHEP